MVDSASNLRFFCLARCHLSNVVRLNRRSENQARVTVVTEPGFWDEKRQFLSFRFNQWWLGEFLFLIKTWWIEHWNLFSTSEFGGQSTAQVANQCCIAGESERQDIGAGSVHAFHHVRAWFGTFFKTWSNPAIHHRQHALQWRISIKLFTNI